MRTNRYRHRVATYFQRRPLVWIDGLELAQVGGQYASRTRISECRRQLGMTIENRQCRRPDGSTLSEYRYVPAPGDLFEDEAKAFLVAFSRRDAQELEAAVRGVYACDGIRITSDGDIALCHPHREVLLTSAELIAMARYLRSGWPDADGGRNDRSARE